VNHRRFENARINQRRLRLSDCSGCAVSHSSQLHRTSQSASECKPAIDICAYWRVVRPLYPISWQTLTVMTALNSSHFPLIWNFAQPSSVSKTCEISQEYGHLCELEGRPSKATHPDSKVDRLTGNRDRATYNVSSPNAVTYTVASPADAPASLTYGPSFLTLAGTYNGSTTIGKWL